MGVGIGQRIRESTQEAALGDEALGERPAEPADVAAEGDLGRPGIVLARRGERAFIPGSKGDAELPRAGDRLRSTCERVVELLESG